jgi:hypothetical protein
MKNMLTGICFLLLSKGSMAQQSLYDKETLLKSLTKPRNSVKIPVPRQQSSVELCNSVTMPADTARFVSSTSLGFIYRLPNSNMPCLKTPNVASSLFPFRNGVEAQIKLVPPKDFLPMPAQIPNLYVGKPLFFEVPPTGLENFK